MKKKLLAFGMAVLMLTGCGSSSGTIRFGAAGLGGTYHMFSDAFAEIIESESADCSIEVKTTAGSAANVRLLSDGYVQMAIAQADIINDAYYGVGMFENDKKYQGYSAVGGLYTEACQIVVRADSDISRRSAGKDSQCWRRRVRNREKCRADPGSVRSVRTVSNRGESGLYRRGRTVEKERD